MHDVYFKPEFLSTETWKDELPGEVSPEVLLWQNTSSAFHLSELADKTCPVKRRVPVLIKTIQPDQFILEQYSARQ